MPGNEAQCPDFVHSLKICWIIQVVRYGTSLWPRTMIFFLKFCPFFTCNKFFQWHLNKEYCHYSNHLSKKFNADQIFEKSCKNADYSSNHQKNLKLGQCLDIDDMTSQVQYGEFTWPSSHFMDRLVFYRPVFSIFYRLISKLANL